MYDQHCVKEGSQVIGEGNVGGGVCEGVSDGLNSGGTPGGVGGVGSVGGGVIGGGTALSGTRQGVEQCAKLDGTEYQANARSIESTRKILQSHEVMK